MWKRTMVMAAGLFLAASGLSAQMGQMHEQRSDTMPGMMGQRMMMGGMSGQGMMGPEMMQMMGQGMGMMATGGPGPAMILRMSDALELTDDQVSRLSEIRDEFSDNRQQHMSVAMAAHQKAAQALEGDSPDFGAYEEALSEAASHMVQAHVTMAQASVQARGVLSQDQRQQLQQGMHMMREMMGEPGMQRGMMQPPR